MGCRSGNKLYLCVNDYIDMTTMPEKHLINIVSMCTCEECCESDNFRIV